MEEQAVPGAAHCGNPRAQARRGTFKLNMTDLTLRGSEELNRKTPRMTPLCDIVTDFLLLLIYN
jgi:hypothetical protein